jgi:hypothetical protein
MHTTRARRARRAAIDVLAYRRWAEAPGTAPIPEMRVVTDPRIHRREHRRAALLAGGAVAAAPAIAPIRALAPATA